MLQGPIRHTMEVGEHHPSIVGAGEQVVGVHGEASWPALAAVWLERLDHLGPPDIVQHGHPVLVTWRQQAPGRVHAHWCKRTPCNGTPTTLEMTSLSHCQHSLRKITVVVIELGMDQSYQIDQNSKIAAWYMQTAWPFLPNLNSLAQSDHSTKTIICLC